MILEREATEVMQTLYEETQDKLDREPDQAGIPTTSTTT